MAEETDFLATHYLEMCTFVNEYMKRLTMHEMFYLHKLQVQCITLTLLESLIFG